MPSPHYKWVALSNTTLGMLHGDHQLLDHLDLAAGDLPRHRHQPALARQRGLPALADDGLHARHGRTGREPRAASATCWAGCASTTPGFAVFSLASIILALDPMRGGGGALWLVLWRLVQGVGGAMLFANASAIIADAFPVEQRGLAIGINQVAAIAGSFIGLIAGGLLSVVDWRLVFWVSVPVGVIGTVWALQEPERQRTPGAGAHRLVGQHHLRRRTHGGARGDRVRDPAVRRSHDGLDGAEGDRRVRGGARVPRRVRRGSNCTPTRRCSTCGCSRSARLPTGGLAGLLAAMSRGGMQFMLIIWLQGIWLPLHGYKYEATPLWAGIYLLPLTIGFLIAGPISGYLSDRHGARTLSTLGMVVVGRQLRRSAARADQLRATGSSPCWYCSTASAAACSRRRTRPPS